MPSKIDVFNHIFPKPFFERLRQVVVNKGAVKRWMTIKVIDTLDITEAERRKIYQGNAERLFNRAF